LFKGLEVDPNPDNIRSSRLMTDIVAATPDLAEKLKLVERLKKAQPEHPQVQDLEAQLAIRRGEAATAAEIYGGLFARFPGERVWMRQLAQAQWKAGDERGYFDTLNAWITSHPEDPAAHALIANGHLRLGQAEEARAALEKTLELAPDHPSSLNNLAWLLRHEDPGLALAYAERAHGLSPDDLAIKDTLGVLLLQAGKHERARSLLEYAAVRSEDPSVQFHYALALTETGDLEKAQRILLEVKDKEFSELEQARALLNELRGE
jgi:predicted Zn-dependent protease